jgi:hypothetical protein
VCSTREESRVLRIKDVPSFLSMASCSDVLGFWMRVGKSFSFVTAADQESCGM